MSGSKLFYSLYFILSLFIITSCGNRIQPSMNGIPNEDSDSSKKQQIEFARKHCEEQEHRSDSAYFPFDTYIIENGPDRTRYMISVTSNTGLCYFEIFDKYGVYANGPGWEGVIVQMIESDLPELSGSIIYESEADACLIRVRTLDDQLRLAEHLRNIFTDESKLKHHLEKLDLSRIDA